MHHLLNWVCQGTIVAMATFALLRALDRSRASTRHAFCWIALLAVLTLPWLPSFSVPSFWAPASSAAEPLSSFVPVTSPLVSMPGTWWTSFPVALGLCAMWSVFFGVRVVRALLQVRSARMMCEAFPSAVESRLRYWNALSAGGRRTRLALSRHTGSAAVLGCGSPIIAVAPALLDHLEAEELDRIIVHEWSHVQRRDDLVNLLQLAIRVVAGWHPAVWWLERQLVIEREMACDDKVVALTGSYKAYASSLTTVASLSRMRARRFASVGVSSSALSRRVLRILSRSSLSTGPSVAAALAALLLLGIVALGLSGLRLVGIAPRVATFETASTAETALAIAPLSQAFTIIAPQSASIDAGGGSETVTAQTPSDLKSTGRTRRRVSEPSPMALAEPVSAPALEPVRPMEAEPVPSAALSSTPLAVTVPLGPDTSPHVPERLRQQQPADGRSGTPWSAAAGAGAAIGRGSQKAGVATATFIGRVGKKIGQSF